MGLFTIEAEGRPVMVVAAEDWEEARACADGDADGDADEEDREDWATFLVEVVDPTGGADDGDGNGSG
jgi:hypothetical protein